MDTRDVAPLNRNEQILANAGGHGFFTTNGLVVTNQRVLRYRRSLLGGKHYLHSFALENLDSIQSYSRRPVIYLLLAVIVGATGIWLSSDLPPDSINVAPISILIGIIFIFHFFIHSRKTVRITSGTTEMIIQAGFLSYEALASAIVKLEEAKRARLNGDHVYLDEIGEGESHD